MITVATRGTDTGKVTTREYGHFLDAAHDISAARLYVNQELVSVAASDAAELAAFRAYCARLKPYPVVFP